MPLTSTPTYRQDDKEFWAATSRLCSKTGISVSEEVVGAIMTLARQAATGSGGLKAVLSSFQSVTGFPIEAQVRQASWCCEPGQTQTLTHPFSV